MKRKITVFLMSCLVLMSVLIISPLNAKAAEFDIDFEPISKSLYLENLDTDTVVYTKSADEKRYPASTTKIMTYIVTTEHVEDIKNTKVTVKSSTLHMLDGTGSSMAGLKAKEELTVYQLLHCLMIPSGNDAALVLADYIGDGDINKFVEMMNEKAKELGCENTHFANPHGLHDEEHYTTASDMAKIAKHAMKQPYFMEICNTVTSDCIGEDRYLVTTNSMIDPVRGGDLYYKFTKGIKTGSTGSDSGYCIVTTAEKGGYTYLCVAYGAPYENLKLGEVYDNGAMQDSINLYEWAFGNLSIQSVIDKNDLVKEIDLEFAWNKDKIQLKPTGSFSAILPDNIKSSDFEREYDLPKSIEAPVKEGQRIGSVTLSYKGNELVKMDLVASETVDRSELLTAFDGIKNVITSKWFIISLLTVIGIIIIYIVSFKIYRRKKKTRRPVKKYRKF